MEGGPWIVVQKPLDDGRTIHGTVIPNGLVVIVLKQTRSVLSRHTPSSTRPIYFQKKYRGFFVDGQVTTKECLLL